MKKLFGEIKMTWPKTIIFAIIAGIYTGAIMLFPALKETSFQDIGISYECWVLFAVIIVVNCQKNWEAVLKCFVFFLISQPLVYIVEIVFGDLGIDWAKSYYFGIWLPMTFATIPGGFIAYYCKKQNLLGSIILGLGNSIQVVLGVYYIKMCAMDFPHHLLTIIFCFVSAVIMSIGIQKKKKYCAISLLIPVAITLAFFVYTRVNGLEFV